MGAPFFATFIKTKGDESLVGAPRTFPLSIPWASCFTFICPFQQFLISQQSLISPDFLPTEKKTPLRIAVDVNQTVFFNRVSISAKDISSLSYSFCS